jgi:hypothetical protein
MIEQLIATLDELIAQARAEVERLDAEAESPEGETWESEEIEEHHHAIGYLEGLDEARKVVLHVSPARNASGEIDDADALDRLNVLLSARTWPGASGLEDVCDIVRGTGREEIPNAPAWASH